MIKNRDIVFIIGGGTSVATQDLSKLREFGYVLGVNESGIIKECDGVFSMDRLWIENRHAFVEAIEIDFFARKSAYRINSAYPTKLFEVDITKKGMCEYQNELWGKNSGFCALNLAYHWRPREIYLFGFDMCATTGRPHYHDNYDWNKKGKLSAYSKWLDDFEIASMQFAKLKIKVFNCSPTSKIRSFQKITWENPSNKRRFYE
jgi:hypothetical protein